MARRRQPAPKWQGELDEPIKWTGPSTELPPLRAVLGTDWTEEEKAALDDASRQASEAVTAEQLRKVTLLAERYQIDLASEGALLSMLLRLAGETVPGVRVNYGSKRPGAPKKWTHSSDAELIADVEAEKRHSYCGDTKACRILITSPRYRKRYGEVARHNIDTRRKSLNTRLIEAPNRRSLATSMLFLGESDPTLREIGLNNLIEFFAFDPKLAEEAKQRNAQILGGEREGEGES